KVEAESCQYLPFEMSQISLQQRSCALDLRRGSRYIWFVESRVRDYGARRGLRCAGAGEAPPGVGFECDPVACAHLPATFQSQSTTRAPDIEGDFRTGTSKSNGNRCDE